jgi:hypothetical protein
MQTTAQNNQSLQQIYQMVARFTVEQQLTIAEHIKKQALAVKWNQFSQTMPTIEPDISEQDIMEEIKAVRAERSAK